MARTISISDDLFSELEALARPFQDKEPEDVIRRLVEQVQGVASSPSDSAGLLALPFQVAARAPRERGAVVEIDGATIHADTVPDLCRQVMEYLYENGYWDKVLELAPYKTSAQRYLFSRVPKHPSGREFFVPIECHGLYVEAHKNYKTSLSQLARFAAKLGVALTYKGA